MQKLKVVDIFCGAGGFSEGFRQAGFKIIHGIDNWEPAIKTFNHNFNLNCEVKNILDYLPINSDTDNIPDSEIIIGSPPCISFSNSNNSGKADKSMGVRLTEAFFKIVAYKKHKKDSSLKAWFMENVPNSARFMKDTYTFCDLGLSELANELGENINAVAITTTYFSEVLNSAHYGAPQRRKRLFVGEIIGRKDFDPPPWTHSIGNERVNLPAALTLKRIRKGLPNPSQKCASEKTKDPIYDFVILPQSQITDHFYDSGLYKCQWENSEYLKRNHPYMGRMSFPEKEDIPSRTVVATKFGAARETMIFESEFQRVGDGEYRIPTIRELACLMSFPITFQFLGNGESAKFRLVGNAVCPSVSRTLARHTQKLMGLSVNRKPKINAIRETTLLLNLNNFEEKRFDCPPLRKRGARFRRHPFKHGNITVTLSNYDILNPDKRKGIWNVSIQYGSGEGFPHQPVSIKSLRKIENEVAKFDAGRDLIKYIKLEYLEKIPSTKELQEFYENNESLPPFLGPVELISKLSKKIDSLDLSEKVYVQEKENLFKYKTIVPLTQLFALYGICMISTKCRK